MRGHKLVSKSRCKRDMRGIQDMKNTQRYIDI
jgi:hypothetical protein